MNKKSAFEAYNAASLQNAGNKKAGNPNFQKTAQTRPLFVVPGSKTRPKKSKQAHVLTGSESGMSDYEMVSFAAPDTQLLSPSSSSPFSTPSKQNGKNSQTQSNGKKSKKSKRKASNGNDMAAGPSTSNAKKQKTSKQNQSSNGGVEIVSLSPSSSASSSSSRSSTPSPSADTVERHSSWFSTSTATAAATTPNSSNHMDSHSAQAGCEAFKYVLSGKDFDEFMAEYWQKQPIYINREDGARHFDWLEVSRKKIDEMLRNNSIEFTKNLDVTSYENGVRQTYNPDGRAYAALVWQYYAQGCSIRLLNPQTYMPKLHSFNATLQEYFHCMVGANIYLTPPNSQGFAPHYDDIEAFVLQIEGQKEWLLYPPRSDAEQLPRESSGNFQESEVGEPVFRHILNPGDTLYFPRGWIHQARTVDDQHSLHITLSVYQKNAFADLFEEMMKQALDQAINASVGFRYGLPVDIWNHFGYTYKQCEQDERRQRIKNHIKTLFRKIEEHLDVDDAVDRLAMKFQHDALPPVLSSVEKQHTAAGTVPKIARNGLITMPEMHGKTQVRLIRANIVRLTKIDDAYHLYYYADNSKEYHENDLNFLEVDDSGVEIIKKLIQQYPKYMRVRDLAPQNFDAAQAVAYELWDRGLLMTNVPLK